MNKNKIKERLPEQQLNSTTDDGLTSVCPSIAKPNVSCRAFWKTIEGQYISATGLYIGKVLVASYSYNGLRSKDAKNETYVVSSSMPGIKRNLGKYETEEECQTRCYEVAETFLKMLRHGS